MGQQVGEGQGFGETGIELEIGQVGPDVRVQVDDILLVELQNTDRCKGFGQGGCGQNGPFRVKGSVCLKVGIAIAFGKKDLTVFDHGKDHARDVMCFHLFGEVDVEEGFELPGIGWTGGLRYRETHGSCTDNTPY